jgi:hypothetical protein
MKSRSFTFFSFKLLHGIFFVRALMLSWSNKKFVNNLNPNDMNKEKVVENIKSRVSSMNEDREEGAVAKAIEAQTSRLPSDVFLWAGVGAMAASLTLKLCKADHASLFVGQLAAPLLLFGVYNKIVKVQGHDQINPVPD